MDGGTFERDRPGVLDGVPWLRRHKVTVDQYDRMAEAGILAPDERVEPIKGEIVDRAPIGSGRDGTLTRLSNRATLAGAGHALVMVQGPLRLPDHSEPQPDILLLKPRPDDYGDSHPTPADVLLVEVSDTLRTDRAVKLPLYARHGVPEVWIVNLPEGVVETYRDPQGDAWRETRRLGRDETLEPALLPGLRLAVSDILRSPPLATPG